LIIIVTKNGVVQKDLARQVPLPRLFRCHDFIGEKMSKFMKAISCVVLTVASSVSFAADVTYLYTGPTYTSFSGAYAAATQKFTTGSLTLKQYAYPGDTSVADRYVDTIGHSVSNSRIVDWSFFDGVNTITKASPDTTGLFKAFFVTTDASGNILGAFSGFELSSGSPALFNAIQDSNYGANDQVYVVSGGTLPTLGGANVAYAPIGVHGTWTVAAVPEPESYAMMLAGLGLMGFIARRRKQSRV